MSLTYIEKSIEPRFDPCGTPDFTIFTDEQEQFTEIYCSRSAKQEVSKLSVFPHMP